MADNQKNLLKISPNLKTIFLPVILILAMATLYLLVITQGYSRVNAELTHLRQAKADENTLNEKLSTLKTVDKSILSNSDASVLALPQEDPAMFAISQLRTSSAQQSSSISDVRLQVRSAIGSKKDLSTAKLDLEIDGPDIDSIVAVLKGIADMAPVTNIDSVNVNSSSLGVSANLELNLYWSPFPTQISKLNEPVQTLNASEKELLDKLAELKKPEFNDLTPQAASERLNPFY